MLCGSMVRVYIRMASEKASKYLAFMMDLPAHDLHNSSMASSTICAHFNPEQGFGQLLVRAL
eukprot:930265-Amphidinium_carterae.1